MIDLFDLVGKLLVVFFRAAREPKAAFHLAIPENEADFQTLIGEHLAYQAIKPFVMSVDTSFFVQSSSSLTSSGQQ